MRSDYGQYHRQVTRVISDGFSDESSRDNSITSSGIHDHSFPNSVLSGVAYNNIQSSNDSLGGYQEFSSSLNPKQQVDTYSVGIIFDRTVSIWSFSNRYKVWQFPKMSQWEQILQTSSLSAAVLFKIHPLWSDALSETMLPLLKTILEIILLKYFSLFSNTTLLLRAGCDTRSVFKWIKACLNSEFSFS